MKTALLTAGIVLTATLGTAWAGGPYTSSLLSDTYAATANGIPTPNDQTDGGAAGGTQIYHIINQLLGTSFTNNAQTDPYQFTGNDNLWKDSGTAFYSLIGVSAEHPNTLRVYDTANQGLKYDVFGGAVVGNAITGDGSAANPYFPAAGSPLSAGTTFGFNLASFANWDSDPSKGDNNGLDHMMTYDLGALAGQKASFFFTDGDQDEITFQHPYLIAFEDLPPGAKLPGRLGDEDFNDNVYLVDGVSPLGKTAIPEPMSVVLFITGALVMGSTLLRRRVLAKA